jgi:hypothetical protein
MLPMRFRRLFPEEVRRLRRVANPTGDSFDMPAGPPVTEAERTTLLARANLVRSTGGNRTGFEALLGAGGMQKIRDRQISRQLQVYYAQLDEMTEMTVLLKQLRAEGVAIGHTLGLSAFGEMDPDRLTAIVRGSPAYSATAATGPEAACRHRCVPGQARAPETGETAAQAARVDRLGRLIPGSTDSRKPTAPRIERTAA